MTPEQFAARIKSHVTTVEVAGQPVTVRKLGAGALLEFRKRTRTIELDDLNRPKNEDDLYSVFSFVASKTLCNEAGELTFDSDDGRGRLLGLPVKELEEIGLRALEWSGLAAPSDDKLQQKKS